MRNSDKEVKQAITTLNRLGYKVHKPTTAKTFQVETDTLRAFLETQEGENLKITEAVSEAFNDWILKKSRS